MKRVLKGLTLAYEPEMKILTLKGKGYISIPKCQLYSVLVFIMRIYRASSKAQKKENKVTKENSRRSVLGINKKARSL